MNVSLNWLAAMLGRPLDAADVAHRLTMGCAAVEAVEPLHQDLGDIIVGLVEQVERHPNADRLSLCRVNDGTQVREVVCGAPNVQAGHRYPYAPVGATLPGGLTLSARKIRGVTSNGMLCSARELGMGADQEGILDLHTDAPAGTRFLDVMPVADTRLVLDVTANRPDLLGHRGVARELAAGYGVPVRLEALPGAAPDGQAPRRVERRGTVGGVPVALEDAAGCPRYIAALIRGVIIRPSPPWLEARLRSIGARPINNVVDATNYVLYELNQPMHAFDLARLRGGAIVVRRARAGERVRTLDGQDRALSPEMTAICDAETAQAVAGVMGGSESEVTARTTDVLLECAFFDPGRVRATRKALRMTTEASYRFERGTDLHAMADAVRRAVRLIRTVAGGEEPEAPVDLWPEQLRPRSVVLRPARVEHLLGVAIPRAEIERHLVAAGFVPAPKDDRLHVQVPGWRPDVTREVDLIEEVARLRGYDTFPVELRPFRPSSVPDDPVERLKARMREALMAWGLHEARTLPLVPAEAGDSEQVALANPISVDHAALRRSLLPGLLAGATRNWAVRERDIRLFEIGARFSNRSGGPEERLGVAAVVSGARTPAHWSSTPADWDVWDVKAMFETAVRLGGPAGRILPEDNGWILVDQAGAQRGRAGPLAADRPVWAAPVLGLEMDLEVREGGVAARYSPIPATPPAERDLALLLPEGTVAQQVEDVVREAAGPLLERVSVFDEYRARDLTGRSVAWRLVFRAPDRTLRDEEVEAMVARILIRLRERLGVERREA
ncbi:MAG TPA: phenylalanine--tRNA ligase subunit beta [Gemmatimonadales bacterium]